MLNPIAFRPGVVTFWTTLTYLALLIAVVIINENPPPAPSEAVPLEGVNQTQAWLQLTTLTRAYHPYNSRENDKVRNYIVQEVEDILNRNGISWKTSGSADRGDGSRPTSRAPASVTIFDDMTSNCTMSIGSGPGGTNAAHSSVAGQAAYFEGTNYLVYIAGKQDDQGDWWEADGVHGTRHTAKGLTLVNAHYDSVSTGFGATDDGMGVVTVLQLISYFTQPGNQPETGILAMFNNGEEDGLYGARAFGQHPLAPYVYKFLNLEGAGAGGRALLFRTTDQEVTAAYAKTPDPFGTVLASDAFGMGVIRSATDYSVLNSVYGQRGLDVAFYKPRARYHTNEDDAKHTSRSSLWHMLSAAVHTMSELSADTGDTFVGPRPDGARGKVANGSPSDGVWFDIFGKGFVLFALRGMFAWSLTVLIATPLILMLLTYILHKLDKYYFFTSYVRTYDQPDYEPVAVGGVKGFFRFPFALVVAGALTLGAAYLMRKVNPFIVYSSRYTVWAMSISLFYFSFWAIMRGSNFVRPSALHRGYVIIWLFILGWAVLVVVTVAEDRLRVGAGYMFVFFESAVFLATLITLFELFALPKKTAWGQQVREDHEARDRLRGMNHAESLPPRVSSMSAPATALSGDASASAPPSAGSASVSAPPKQGDDDDADASDSDAAAANEQTPLIGGNATDEHMRTTFATTYRRSISALVNGARNAVRDDGYEPFEYEQPWSGHLPSWLWFFQFLILGPFTIILAAQTGLLLTDATHQTGADGSNPLLPYLIVFFFTVLLLLPLTPFMHRITHHIPNFLLVVFVASLIYNLVMFPFSAENRYKAFFLQTIDLDTSENKVCYTGIERYIRPIIAEMPSASGRDVTCGTGRRPDLTTCCYDGSEVAPRLNDDLPDGIPAEVGYADLLSINVTRNAGNSARLEVNATNTKACFLEFKRPVSSIAVQGSSGWDDRFGVYPEGGIGLIKLWRRDYRRGWVVDVEWKDYDDEPTSHHDGSDGDDAALGDGELRRRDSGLDGHVKCIWSDANTPNTIPALDEGLKFSPRWVAITKTSEGLVEGQKSFMV